MVNVALIAFEEMVLSMCYRKLVIGHTCYHGCWRFRPYLSISGLQSSLWSILVHRHHVFFSTKKLVPILVEVDGLSVSLLIAIAIFCAHRPRPHRPQPHHRCYRQIKATISRHRKCFPHFGDLSILDRLMLEIFRKQKLYLTCESYMWENQIP